MGSKNESGECCLRWNGHQSLLHGVCNSLLTSEKFADVTLYCEGMSLKCHKFILSACSPYFDQVFSETNIDHPIIILKDVSYWEMQSLLHFIYMGELTTDERRLSSLIELARSLHIRGIGDFGTQSEEENQKSIKKSLPKMKQESQQIQHGQDGPNTKEYVSNINSLSDHLVSLPSHPLLGETLSTSVDNSDYPLQETGGIIIDLESEIVLKDLTILICRSWISIRTWTNYRWKPKIRPTNHGTVFWIQLWILL